MKRVAILVFGTLCFVLVFFTIRNSIKISSRIQQEKDLPNIALATLSLKKFDKNELKKGVKTCLIYYDYTCENCEYELKYLQEKSKNLNSTEILLVAAQPFNLQAISTWAAKNPLYRKKNVHFLLDQNNSFARTFHPKLLPTTLVYDENEHLIKRYDGLSETQDLYTVLK